MQPKHTPETEPQCGLQAMFFGKRARHPGRIATRRVPGLPPNPDGLNFDRAAWAHKAIIAFREETGTDLEDALCDLLCDLMHWADRAGCDFTEHLERAIGHYEAETETQPL